MERFLHYLICVVLISAFAAAQEQYEHITACVDPMPKAERNLEPIHDSGRPNLYLADSQAAVQIFQPRIDMAKMVLPADFGNKTTALLSEDKMRPYCPVRGLMYCQFRGLIYCRLADLSADGSNAIH